MGRRGLTGTAGTTAGAAERPGSPQTSDGVVGERASAVPAAFRVADTWTTVTTYAVAPGVTFEQFYLSGPRGDTRGQLVRIDPATAGIGLDLVAGQEGRRAAGGGGDGRPRTPWSR